MRENATGRRPVRWGASVRLLQSVEGRGVRSMPGPVLPETRGLGDLLCQLAGEPIGSLVVDDGCVVSAVSLPYLRGLGSRERRALAAGVLSSSELERLGALRLARRRLEWLAGRAAAKYAVSRLDALEGRALIDPRALVVATDRSGLGTGRPLLRRVLPRLAHLHDRIGRERASAAVEELDDPRRLGISHSGDVAVAAAAWGPVGIDVERVRHFPPALLEMAFDASERECLATGRGLEPGLTSDERVALLWTCKEAALKLVGLGIGAALQEIHVHSFSFDRGFSVRISDQLGGPMPWHALRSLGAVGAGHAMALLWLEAGQVQGSRCAV